MVGARLKETTHNFWTRPRPFAFRSARNDATRLTENSISVSMKVTKHVFERLTGVAHCRAWREVTVVGGGEGRFTGAASEL